MRATQPILANQPISAPFGMVVAQHPLGAKAGLDVLAGGGNAVDAAVTTAFTMGVVQPLMNGIGGGGQMVVHFPDGAEGAVDYGMHAPAAATGDMYELLDDPEPQSAGSIRFSRRFNWPQVKDNAHLDGHSSIATPGTVAGLAAALEKWGTIDLADALAPAISLARNGFPIGHHMSLALVAGRDKFLKFPGATPIFYPNGQPLAVGERLVQSEYADTLELIARDGPDAFYRSEIAERIAAEAQSNSAVLSADDFASYEPVIYDELLRTTYHDVEILATPGPGAAPTLFEILNILSNFDLTLLEQGTPESLHTIIEAVKLAAVDRFTYLGDCAPNGGPADILADPDYAAKRALEIGRFAAVAEPGNPWSHTGIEKPADYPAPSGIGPDDGTTHLTVVDAQGAAVSLTQTLHGYSGVVTPGVGAMMNNGMGWFYPGPGTVNSVSPNGRGLHNMVPVILLENGRLRAALGASGGRRIWTAVLQAIINYVDYGMSLQNAVQSPRVHTETDVVLVDGRFDPEIRASLAALGHDLIVATPRYDSAPYSEPNGIAVVANNFESAIHPVAKPTIALGLESPTDTTANIDLPDLANDLMP